MMIHPRYWIVTEAHCSLDMAVLQAAKKHGLDIEQTLDIVFRIMIETNKVQHCKDRARVVVLSDGGKEILKAVADLEQKHELTPSESIKNLIQVAQLFNMFAVRHERHPNDPDKKGDEA